jgi:multiple sugar transport system permease protein
MNEKSVKRVLLAAGIVFMLVFCVAPFVWMITVSVSRDPDFLSGGVDFVATAQNYVDILTIKSLHFLEYLRNSLAISGIVAAACAMVAALSAYAVSRLEFRGRLVLSLAVLAFSMFPQISLIGYLYKLMRSTGLINTYVALVFPYIAWTIPLGFWILLSYMMQIPKDLDEAALADGAGRFLIFRRIVLPISTPGMLSAVLLIFIAARTVPVGIALFEGLHGQIPWGYIMAASTLASLPLVALAVFFQKYVIQDVTRGALKG